MTSPSLKFVAELDAVQLNDFTVDAERYAAKEAARRLLARLETPFERAWTLVSETPVLIAALQTCRNLGIWFEWFRIWKEGQEAEERTLTQIIALCQKNVDANLLRRLFRHVAALHVLEETGIDTWKATRFSLALGDEASHLHHLLDFGTDHSIITGVNLPRLLEKNAYQEPLDLTKIDNYTDVTGVDYWERCRREPDKAKSFMESMTALRNGKMDWTDVYDTRRIVEGADLTNPARPLFVDIGGLHGIDSARLLARHLDLPDGSLIVQDLPGVVAANVEKIDPRIRKMEYDFFTPQPLIGARAYFFHAVPHDWPDADCLRIFGNVAAAMDKNYSRLLIYEIVLPVQGASSLMSTLDLQLMNMVSGLERTEEHWRGLLEKSGLKIVNISRHFRALESVIEAILA